MGPGSSFSIICLSDSGWDVPLPTNRQQIMRRAAERGHEVLFVETGPFFGRKLLETLRRRPRRLRELVSPVQVAPRVATMPAMNLLPFGHRRRLPNAINNRLTAAMLRRQAGRLRRPVIVWIYDPSSASVAGACGEDFAVYDCVDDFPSVAFYDGHRRTIATMGDRLAAERSRLVFTTSSALRDRHSKVQPRTTLVRNVGDYAHFSPATDRSFAAAEVASLSGPVIGFAGNFMSGKVDLEMVEAVAARSSWTLLLVGPADEAARGRLERLVAERPNVTWVGPKPYADVPRYVAAFDVGLCPNAWNEYGRSCFPLKVFEYLAAGKPVVVSGNPEVAGMEPDVLLARGADAFVAAVEQALERLAPEDRERRIELASRNTWDTRVDRLLSLVEDELARPASPDVAGVTLSRKSRTA